MKRVISLILATIMVLSIVCCMGFTASAAEIVWDNLSNNKTYTTSAVSSNPGIEGVITDGVKAPAAGAGSGDAAYLGLTKAATDAENGYAWVIIDLEEVCHIDNVVVTSGTKKLGDDITAVSEVVAYTSLDGKAFAKAATKTNATDPSDVNYTDIDVSLGSAHGRYVKLLFLPQDPANNKLVWLTEITVNGKVLTNPTKYNPASLEKTGVAEYACGVKGCGETLAVELPVADPEKEVLTICDHDIDGILTNRIWKTVPMIDVDTTNGRTQNTDKDGVTKGKITLANGSANEPNFKYALATDGTYLYIAVQTKFSVVKKATTGTIPNGNATNIRFWTLTGEKSTVYDDLFDTAVNPDGKAVVTHKRPSGDQDTNAIAGVVIDAKNGFGTFEIKIPLSEFNATNSFNYYISVSNIPETDKNQVLTFPSYGKKADFSDGNDNAPASKWNKDNDIEFITNGVKSVDYVGFSAALADNMKDYITVLAGDEKTVAELTKLGCGKENALRDAEVYAVDADGYIVEVSNIKDFGITTDPTVTDKSKMVCPKGGYLLVAGYNKALKLEKGLKVTLLNLDVNAFRGLAGCKSLDNVSVDARKHTCNFIIKDNELPSLNQKKTVSATLYCSCGASKVSELANRNAQLDNGVADFAINRKVEISNIRSGSYGTDYIDCATDGKISAKNSYNATTPWLAIGSKDDTKGTVSLDLGAKQTIDCINVHWLLGCSTDGTMSPKTVTLEVSADGKTYTKVATKNYEAVSNKTGLKATWETYKFSAVSARYIRMTAEKNVYVAGDKDNSGNLISGKYPNFMFFDEFVVSKLTAENNPIVDGHDMTLTINDAGLRYEPGYTSIMAGDNLTVRTLSYNGWGTAKDCNYGTKIFVDAKGNVAKVIAQGTGCFDEVCPAGGYIIFVNAESAQHAIAAKVVVGDRITLYNVDVNQIRGAVDFQDLTGAYALIDHHTSHTYTGYTQTKAPTMDAAGVETGTCVCGATDTRTGAPALDGQVIVFDGLVDDPVYTNWTHVDTSNGTIQDGELSELNQDLPYDFATYSDGTYLRVAVKTTKDFYSKGGNPEYGFYVRLMFNDHYYTAAKWISFYDFYTNMDGKEAVRKKVKPNPDGSAVQTDSIDPDGEVANWKIHQTFKTVDKKDVLTGTTLELAIPLKDLPANFSYYIGLGYSENNDSKYSDVLWYPAVTDNKQANLPYNTWDFDHDIEFTGVRAPGDAKALTYAGYKSDVNDSDIIMIAGDGKTVKELTKLGSAEDKLTNAKLVVVNSFGIVSATYEKSTDKSAVTCPAGGYILYTNGTELDLIKVDGLKTNKATLYGLGDTQAVAIAQIAGKGGYEKLLAAKVAFTAHTHSYTNPVNNPATLAKPATKVTTCSCGMTQSEQTAPMIIVQPDLPKSLFSGADYTKLTSAVAGNYYTNLTDGRIASGVNWVADEWYNVKKQPTVTITRSEKAKMDMIRIHVLDCKNSSGISNFKSLKLEVSADGTNYKQIAYQTWEEREQTSAWNPVWLTYKFDEMEVKSVKLTFDCYTNFGMIDEVEAYSKADFDVKIPDGAIMLDYAGYKHAGATSLVAGDNMTVAELTALGYGAARDMNYAYNIVVSKDNIVLKTEFGLGNEPVDHGISDWVCPAGGYIITYNANKAGYDAMSKIQVGAKINVVGFDIETMRGKADCQALVNAYFTYENPTGPVENVITVDVDAKAILTDGVKDVKGKWGSETANDKTIVLTQNTKCTSYAADLKIVKNYKEATKINTVKLDFYHDAMSMIGYPEGKVTLFASADGTKFDKVGEFDLAKAEVSTSTNGTVETVLEFDAIEVKAFYAVVTYGSSTAVLGDKPAGGKIFWEWTGLTEVEASFVEREPEVPGDIYGNDGVINAMDYMLIRAYALGSAKDVTDAQVKAMDVNKDGTVNAVDVALVRALVLGTKKPEDLLQK